MAAKFCVFCGGPPKKKSREHIIPRWLLALTGDPARKVFLGRDWTSPRLPQRVYSFDAFTFPACEACNTAFSRLESEAKRVVASLLELRPVASGDLDVLLDWLDKVRVGVWLGMLSLNRLTATIEPQFHISARIGVADRLMVIYRDGEALDGIGLGGVESPIFRVMPSCFSLTINHLHIVNASAPMLLAERFGLPYVVSRQLVRDREGVAGDLVDGHGAPRFPLLPYRIASRGVAIYQPIIPSQEARAQFAHHYDTDFVRASCANYATGRGHVFVVDGERLVPYPSESSGLWMPPTPMSKLEAFSETALMSGEWLDAMYADIPSTSSLTTDQAAFVRDSVAGVRALHAKMMEHLVEQIAGADGVYTRQR